MTDKNIWSLLQRKLPNNSVEQQRIFELSKQTRGATPAIMQEQIRKMRDACGICCFTSDPHNKLMWANYGRSDTGVVIGFNLPPYSPHIHDLFVMKVLYEQERSVINYFDKPHTLFPIWAYVKNDVWSYEKEIRAVAMSYNGLLNLIEAASKVGGEVNVLIRVNPEVHVKAELRFSISPVKPTAEAAGGSPPIST